MTLNDIGRRVEMMDKTKTVKKEQCLTEITSNIFNILIMGNVDIVTNVNSL
jgi:hypothetical protein